MSQAAFLLRPTTETTPDEWGAENRTYPPTAGRPGPRDPWLTPYTIEFARVVASRRYRRVVLAMAAQGGKTDSILDIIGQRLDQRPVPILYVGPNRQFLQEQFEPRLMALLDEAPVLSRKVARGKRMTKTRKFVAGVPTRLAHAGSSTALKSDPAGLAITDEADELMANVKGQGDPVGLVDARGDTYDDFVHAIVSTPSRGTKETTKDEVSSLEFWASQDAEDIGSTIWKLWQQGTRFHWTWRCPSCRERFVPRFACLHWDGQDKDVATPAQARATAHLVCPRHGCIIGDDAKEDMNSTGRYVAPGQTVTDDDVVVGDPPASDTCSFWVSGLCSPFRSFGDRAAAYVEALQSGDPDKVQTVINAGFGELFSIDDSGDVPEWQKLLARVERDLVRGHVPPRGLLLVGFADVQMRGLWVEIVAYAPNGESWSVDAFYIDGDTSRPDGPAFEQLRRATVGRQFPDAFGKQRRLDVLGVDSGYRSHIVYEWVRRTQRAHPDSGRDVILATKGLEGWGRPAIGQPALVDIDLDGKKIRQGARVWGIGTWPLKAAIYSDLRVEFPREAIRAPHGYCHFGSWNDEIYFKQLTGERLIDVKFQGRTSGRRWIKIRENHFHDCRVGCRALADYLGLNNTTPEEWAALATARGMPPELAEAAVYAPEAEAAPVVEPREAQAAERARRTADQRRRDEAGFDLSRDAADWLEGYDVEL